MHIYLSQRLFRVNIDGIDSYNVNIIILCQPSIEDSGIFISHFCLSHYSLVPRLHPFSPGSVCRLGMRLEAPHGRGQKLFSGSRTVQLVLPWVLSNMHYTMA